MNKEKLNQNWLHDLFIDEAKAAKNYHNRGGSGGSGGAGIIDVTELPTENIDENAVYRMSKNEVNVYIIAPEAGIKMTMDEFFNMGEIPKICVDELPENMENLPYMYVLNSTGVVYVTDDGGATRLTFGEFFQLMADETLLDGGWIDNPASAIEQGVYSVKSQVVRRYVYIDGVWVEIVTPVADFVFTLNADGASYSVAANNKELFGIVEIPSTYNDLPVTEIAAGGFRKCYGISKIILPDSVKTINESAFAECTSLLGIVNAENTDETGGNGVTVIGDWAFHDCCSLVVGGLPVNVQTIGEGAFYNCVSLIGIREWSNLTALGDSAFEGCVQLAITATEANLNGYNGLTYIMLPNSVLELSNRVFYGNLKATSVKFLGQPNSINANALSNMTQLKHIYVPWAEGAVANAPWGADNATIYYNSNTANMG